MKLSRTQPRSALETAVKLLATRSHFESELRQKLSRFPDQEVEEAVLELRNRGYLNDAKALQTFCDEHQGKRLLSSESLAQLLSQKGVQVDRSSLPNPTVENMVTALHGKKFDPASGQNERSRAARWLSTRGFDEQEVESALSLFFGDTDPS